jgi:hypothetical protein
MGLNMYPPCLSTADTRSVASSRPPPSDGSVKAHSISSPDLIGPTPAGVPVRMRSPSCVRAIKGMRRARGR